MMEAIQVIKITFNGMENSLGNAIEETLIGTFVEGNTRSAFGNASKFIEELPLERHYTGWDYQVYPQFKINKIQISNK